MPDRISSRIALAFAAVAIVATLAAAGGLFVSLRNLHREQSISTLGDIAQPIATRVRRQGLAANLVQELDTVAPTVQSDMGVYGIIGRRLVTAQASAAGADVSTIPIDPALGPGDATGGELTAADGSRLLYGLTVVRAQGAAAGPAAIVLTLPDRSAALAIEDLLHVLPVVLVLTTLVAVPIAWGLSRSITRPLRRLAEATAALPGASTEPVPSEGPREVRELTERFNETTAELELVRAEERELLSSVRHDLRTPLTVVAGFAEALRDGTASGDQVSRAGDAIAEEAARIERMIDDLRSIDELGTGRIGLRPELVDGAALVADAAARFGPRATAAGVTVSAAADPGVSLVGDRHALERILGNLVDNALGSARPGGQVLVESRAASGSSRVAGMPGPAGWVALRVSDDGPGFPPGSLDRVFDRFYRADPARSGGGSGLGLSIVRALATAHGGTASAENLAPTGARVTVLLPVSQPPLGAEASAVG
jgi:two-component system OmpR family sensor kinase